VPTPLIQSIPYVKAWLDEHPRKNVPNSPFFVSLNNQSNHYTRQLTREGLYGVHEDYKKAFFPKLLQDLLYRRKTKRKKVLLAKPWNPYTLRHSGLTEKARKIKEIQLRMYAGWSPNSKMPQKYVHYFGNESSESLLEA